MSKADESVVERAIEEGFRITPVAADLNFLQVRVSKSKSRLSEEELERLHPLSEQITWLDLSRLDVSDKDLRSLSDFKHLTRLSLQNTSISDSTLYRIGSLEHLEYLNVYGTEVSDEGLKHLENLKSLRDLYLWQTHVSRQGIDSLQSKLPDVEINNGEEAEEISERVVLE